MQVHSTVGFPSGMTNLMLLIAEHCIYASKFIKNNAEMSHVQYIRIKIEWSKFNLCFHLKKCALPSFLC